MPTFAPFFQVKQFAYELKWSQRVTDLTHLSNFAGIQHAEKAEKVHYSGVTAKPHKKATSIKCTTSLVSNLRRTLARYEQTILAAIASSTNLTDRVRTYSG